MNLREKLAALKGQQEKQVTAVIPKEIEMPPGTAEMPGAVIREKLRQLGSRKLVNPPPADLFAEEQEKPAPEAEQSPELPADEDPFIEEPAGDVCPTCGKAFKVLAKHKCKTASEIVPKAVHQEADGDTQYPTSALSEEPHSTKVPSNIPSENSCPVDKKIIAAMDGNDAQSFILLIDCVPLNRMFTYAQELAAPVIEAICKENKVEHWSSCEYGTGAGKLQARFENMLGQLKAFPPCIVINTQSIEAKALIDPLIKYAAIVFRGVR